MPSVGSLTGCDDVMEEVVAGPNYSNRLDRIENKLDSVVETLNALARVEERQFAANKRMDRFEFRLDHNEGEIDQIKGKLTHTSTISKGTERLLWVLFAAVLSSAARYFGV
jgi:tetrahydromethanopterin S-methyltransferase subunit G